GSRRHDALVGGAYGVRSTGRGPSRGRDAGTGTQARGGRNRRDLCCREWRTRRRRARTRGEAGGRASAQRTPRLEWWSEQARRSRRRKPSRKVRTPQGREAGNTRPPRGEDQRHSDDPRKRVKRGKLFPE